MSEADLGDLRDLGEGIEYVGKFESIEDVNVVNLDLGICFVIGSSGMLSDFGICLGEYEGESAGLMRVALATMFGESDVNEVSVSEYRRIYLSEMSDVDRDLVRDYLLLVDKMGDYCDSFRGLLNSLGELEEFHLD